MPPLRFPEFTEEWEKQRLNEYLEENKTRNTKGLFSKKDVLSVSGDYGIVNQIDLLGRSFAGVSVANYHVVRKGDIVYTKSPLKEYPYGIVKSNKGADGIVSTLYAVYETKSNTISNFVEYYFALASRTNKYFKPIVRIGAKHDMKIGNDEVLDNFVSFPKLDEQRKISEFLSLIEKRIALQTKIIEKYKSLIKGIIYQVKTNGLRYDTWQKTELRNVLEERNEKNIKGCDVYSVSVIEGVVNQIEYLGRSFAAKNTLQYNVVKYGDIVYTRSPTGDFPYGIVKRSNVRCDVAVSPLYGVYKPVNDYLGVIIHFYFMQPNNALNYLHPLVQKGAKNTINITNRRFLENTIPLPKAIDEAKRLACILISIQSKIVLEQDFLHSYQKQKQYLLRQMFI